MLRLATVAVVAMTVVAGPVRAENSPMEQCAVQWRDLAAAGKTAGQDYRVYAAACLKAGATSPAQPVRSATGKVKRPNRMSVCAGQWRQMKAQNNTRGMTYRQWSSQCLRAK